MPSTSIGGVTRYCSSFFKISTMTKVYALLCLKKTILSFTFSILASPTTVASFDLCISSTVRTSPRDGIDAVGPKCLLLVDFNSWSTNCLRLLSYKSPSKFRQFVVWLQKTPLGKFFHQIIAHPTCKTLANIV